MLIQVVHEHIFKVETKKDFPTVAHDSLPSCSHGRQKSILARLYKPPGTAVTQGSETASEQNIF